LEDDMAGTAVDRLLAAVGQGTGVGDDVFADDAAFDATVPHWRFALRGADPIRRQLTHWFRDPAEFEELVRTPTPDGEVVTFQIAWYEDGVLHAAHQSHLLEVRDDRIVSDTMFCGGRWPAPLLAEMAGA
jgi:hypothetical protein